MPRLWLEMPCTERGTTQGAADKLDGWEIHFNDDDHDDGSGGSEFTIVLGKIKGKIWQLSVIFL